VRRLASRGDEGRHDDVGIEHNTHSGFAGLFFSAALGADLSDCFVNDALDFIGVAIGVALPDVLKGALKHTAADSVLDKFGEVAFFCTLGTQECAQGQISVLRNLDAPTDGLLLSF